MAASKMKHRFSMQGDAGFKFGITEASEFETWGAGIKFLDKWFYMDDNHPKIGSMRIFRNWKIFQEAQFTAHYQLKALERIDK
jgi:hypothetical protein